MDRLARNLRDLQKLVDDLTCKKITIHFHKENLVFNGNDDHLSRLMLQIMGAVAEFERANIKERQMEGIRKAQAMGKHLGRVAKLNDEQVKEMISRIETGETKSTIAKYFDISTQTLYSTLKRNGYKIKPVKKPVKVVNENEKVILKILKELKKEKKSFNRICDIRKASKLMKAVFDKALTELSRKRKIELLGGDPSELNKTQIKNCFKDSKNRLRINVKLR